MWEKLVPERGTGQWKSARVELGLARMRSSVAGGVAGKA